MAHEAFGVDAIGGIQNGLTLLEDERGLLVVNQSRCEQAQPGAAVFLVVPAEKSLRKSAAVLNTTEAARGIHAFCKHNFKVSASMEQNGSMSMPFG